MRLYLNPDIAKKIIEIIRLAVDQNYNELERRDLIEALSVRYIKESLSVVDNNRYIVPVLDGDIAVSIVRFSDGRGYAIEVPIKVTMSPKDDLEEVIFGFEQFGDVVRLTNVYW